MSKITELSKEQEAKIAEYREEFRSFGLCTKPCDRDAAQVAVSRCYEFLGKKPPKHFVWLDSPAQGAIAAHICKNLGSGKVTGSQLRDQLGSQLRDQLRDQLWDQLRDQLWDQLRDQLGSQLRDQLWDQLWDQLRDQLWDQLRDQLYQVSWGNHEAFWISLYCYINEVLPVKKSEGADIAREISKHCGWYWAFENMVILTERPEEIYFDEERRLHRDTGPSIRFKDGYSVFALNGIRMTGNEWVCEAPSEKLDPEKIMAIENVEQRLMAIKKCGIERILHKLESKIISEMDEYKLHEVSLYGTNEKLLEMKNPSEPKTHYEWVVPECNTVSEAMAWRCGFDSYNEPVAKT